MKSSIEDLYQQAEVLEKTQVDIHEAKKETSACLRLVHTFEDRLAAFCSCFVKAVSGEFKEALNDLLTTLKPLEKKIRTCKGKTAQIEQALRPLIPKRKPRMPRVVPEDAFVPVDVAPPAPAPPVAVEGASIADAGEPSAASENPPEEAPKKQPRGPVTAAQQANLLKSRIAKVKKDAQRELKRLDNWEARNQNMLTKTRKAIAKISTKPGGRKQTEAEGVKPALGTSGAAGRDTALVPASPAVPVVVAGADAEQNAKLWADAPQWQRDFAAKKLELVNAVKGMNYKQINEFVTRYNAENDRKISYATINRARKAYEADGLAGLFSGYGPNNNMAEIKPEWLKSFGSLYLKEGEPTAASCRKTVAGQYKQDLATFPAAKTFVRRLYKTLPKDAILRRRKGDKWYRRNCQHYVERDYSKLRANQCWVSDHAQLDVAVLDELGKPCFPWATAWRDMKSGRMLAYYLHSAPPNSDHIFQSFYYAVKEVGSLPEMVYLDNGKDYRCRDFAGGRNSKVRVRIEDQKRSTLSCLGIEVHFALPYNAQSKPIERDFLWIKTNLSKLMPGYRGGNVVERPGCLQDEIRRGRIITFKECEIIAKDFIENTFNKAPRLRSRILKGKSPLEAWNSENPEKRFISDESLGLFCMRTSKNISVGRNGVEDSRLQLKYWHEILDSMFGAQVYMRRDPADYAEAWIFSAEDDRFICKARAGALSAPVFAKTKVEKARLTESIKVRRRQDRRTERACEAFVADDPMENIRNAAVATAINNVARGVNLDPPQNTVTRIIHTPMDDAVRKQNAQENEGMYDLSLTAPTKPETPKLIEWEFESEVHDDD